jgi:ATP adenylyltransferase
MDHLHAPWRIDYILSPKEPQGDESLFTRIAQSGDDVANLVVHRDKTCYVMMNRYPYNGGHLMVVPYKQVAELEDLDDQELADLMRLSQRSIKVLKEVMQPQGFNVGLNLGRVAGAGIREHLHLHVVPRWNGDTNFMPVIGNTAVLPEALEALAEKLRTVFAAMGGSDSKPD